MVIWQKNTSQSVSDQTKLIGLKEYMDMHRLMHELFFLTRVHSVSQSTFGRKNKIIFYFAIILLHITAKYP